MSADMKSMVSGTKPRMFLIPFLALIGLARVLWYGARKYAPGNWHEAALEDGAAERYTSACTRHLAALQEPDGTFGPSLGALDEESGLPHIDHAICCLIILRGIVIKGRVLPADPGLGNDPPKASAHVHTGKYSPGGAIAITCGHAIRAGEGVSVQIDPDDLSRQPVDVHAPSIYPEGDPTGVRPFREGLPLGGISQQLDHMFDLGIAEGEKRAAEARAETCHDRPHGEHDPPCRICDAPARQPRPTGPGETGIRNAQPVDEAARAANALADGAAGRGPRFILVRAEHVPAGAVAEFYWTSSVATGCAHRYNSGSFADFDPANFRRDRHPGSPRVAVVDTRPQEGGY